MKLRHVSLLATVLAISSHARPLSRRDVQWGPCTDINLNSSLLYDCGTLPVPLDYSDASRGNISLQLTRIPTAGDQPARGSILFNFGGPGEEARKTMVSFAEVFQA